MKNYGRGLAANKHNGHFSSNTNHKFLDIFIANICHRPEHLLFYITGSDNQFHSFHSSRELNNALFAKIIFGDQEPLD